MALGRVRCRAMPTSSEVRRQLTVILGGVILIVLITLIPDLAPPSPDIGAPVEAYKGEILEIIPPDVGGSDAGGAPVFTAQVLLLDGALKGQTVTAFVEGPGGSQLVAAYAPGDQVVVTITQDANEPEPYIAVADRWRFEPIAALIILFAVGVTVVGGWQGVRALVALGLDDRGDPERSSCRSSSRACRRCRWRSSAQRRSRRRPSCSRRAGARAAPRPSLARRARCRWRASSRPGSTAAAQFTYTSSDLAYIVTQGGSGPRPAGHPARGGHPRFLGVLDDVTVTQAVVVDELSERGGLEGRGAVPQRPRHRAVAHRRHGQHAVPRLCRRVAAAARRPADQQPADRADLEQRGDRDRDRPDPRRQPRDRGGRALDHVRRDPARRRRTGERGRSGRPAPDPAPHDRPGARDHPRRVRAPRGDRDPPAHQRSRRAADRGAARRPVRRARCERRRRGRRERRAGPRRRAAPRGTGRGRPDQHRRRGGRHASVDDWTLTPGDGTPPSASRRRTRRSRTGRSTPARGSC